MTVAVGDRECHLPGAVLNSNRLAVTASWFVAQSWWSAPIVLAT